MERIDPVNERERVSRKGWRLKHRQAIALATLPEWRTMRYTGEVITHV